MCEEEKEPPVSACRLFLVRHGETDWNIIHRLQGWTDTKLNATGIAQAEATAKFLGKQFRGRDVSAIYASDLQRACMTAAPISEALSLPIHKDSRLREHNLGVMQGHTIVEVRAKFAAEFAEYFGDWNYRIPEGESMADKYARVSAALADIGKKHQGETVIVVTHGGVLDCCYRYASQIPVTEPCNSGKRPNCCVSELQCSRDGEGNSKWKVVSWAAVEHLASVPPTPAPSEHDATTSAVETRIP